MKLKKQKKDAPTLGWLPIGKVFPIISLSYGLSWILAVVISPLFIIDEYTSDTPRLLFYIKIAHLGLLIFPIVCYFLWKWRIARKIITVLGLLTAPLMYFLILSLAYWFVPDIVRSYPPIKGPENVSLLSQSYGIVAASSPSWPSGREGSDIKMTSLPSGKVTYIHLSDRVNSLVGDRNGQVFFTAGIDNIQIIRYIPGLDIREEVTSYQNSPYKNFLTLSPSSNRIAYVTNVVAKYIRGTDGYFNQGSLEVFDMATNKRLPFSIPALASNIAWESENAFYYATFENDKSRIYFYDVKTGENKYITDGFNPILSPDKKKVLFIREKNATNVNWDLTVKLFDLTTQQFQDVDLPGLIPFDLGTQKGLLGFAGPDKVVYWANATRGKLSFQNASLFMPGESLVTIKMANLKDGTFQTIVEGLNAADEAGFTYCASCSR